MPRKENDQLSAFLDRLLNINPVGGLGGSVIETSDLSVKERETLEGLIEWGSVRQVMSGIYVHVWRDEADPPPETVPHQLAAAVCRTYGWRLALPRNVAAYLLGLGELPLPRPIGGRFPYDQGEPFRIPEEHLSFEPGRPELFDGVSPVGQALILATPTDISLEGLRELGQIAGRGVMSVGFLVDLLCQDLESGGLGEREETLAQIIIETIPERTGKALRRAPVSFQPPDRAPVLAGWSIATFDDNECLIATSIHGHPNMRDGSGRFRSSPLVWVDERIGWAKTESRWYRLESRMIAG